MFIASVVVIVPNVKQSKFSFIVGNTKHLMESCNKIHSSNKNEWTSIKIQHRDKLQKQNLKWNKPNASKVYDYTHTKFKDGSN